ncbi:hypothetical protein HYT58_00135 [Candidatus Woesearchaeota archaeon]|nr:hypothetical protein [Candidatus Woesearchaeota archaeon]
MAKIIIDYREKNSGIVEELESKHVNYEVRELKIADYAIQSKARDGSLIRVGCERKTQSDFINSIIDKRILSQLIVLKENFDIPLLIIEGSENIYELRNFHPNAIRGMLASIAIDFRIPVVYTKNIRDTAALLVIISNRIDKPIKPISLLDKRKPTTTKEYQEYLVESLPGVGPTIAKELLKKFKTVRNIFNASENELKEVPKVGKKKAAEIKKLIESSYD